MEIRDFLLQFWVLPGLVVTTAATSILFALQVSQWKGSEHLADLVASGRTLIAVSVQIISHILGMVMVQALCAIYKIHLRTVVRKKPVSLEYARFMNALSSPLFAIVPGAIWSGAMTPTVVTTQVLRTIDIPSYANLDPANPWNETSGPWVNEKGFFSYDPAKRVDVCLNSARQASGRNASERVSQRIRHTKLDNSGYTYVGRSYGTGSSVGLNSINNVESPLWYKYNESGLVATAKCERNESSNFWIYDWYGSDNGRWSVAIGLTQGSFPDGTEIVTETQQFLFGSQFRDLFGMDSYYNNDSRTGYAMLTPATADPTLDLYSMAQFNQTHCTIQFASRTVEVYVDTRTQEITTGLLDELSWPHYGDSVTERAIDAIGWMSRRENNGWSGSSLARALVLNAQNLREFETQNSSSIDIPGDILLTSVSEFVISIFDNMLVNLAATRLIGSHETQSIEAQGGVYAVVVGSKEYIYVIAVLNLLILALCCYQVLIRRIWSDVADLDFADIADVALNASKGGRSLFSSLKATGTAKPGVIQFSSADAQAQWPAIVVASSRYTNGVVLEE